MKTDFTVTVKGSYYRKTKGNERIVRRNIEKYGKSLMMRTHQRARDLAPNLSGRLRNFILVKEKVEGDRAFNFEVYTENPTEGGSYRMYPSKKYPNFNLIRWMHETGGVFKSDNPFGKAGTKHIKSGDPRFMITAKQEAIEEVQKLIRSKGNKIKQGLVS